MITENNMVFITFTSGFYQFFPSSWKQYSFFAMKKQPWMDKIKYCEILYVNINCKRTWLTYAP